MSNNFSELQTLPDAHLSFLELYFQKRLFEAFTIRKEKWICVTGWVKSVCVCVCLCLSTPGARHTKHLPGCLLSCEAWPPSNQDSSVWRKRAVSGLNLCEAGKKKKNSCKRIHAMCQRLLMSVSPCSVCVCVCVSTLSAAGRKLSWRLTTSDSGRLLWSCDTVWERWRLAPETQSDWESMWRRRGRRAASTCWARLPIHHMSR